MPKTSDTKPPGRGLDSICEAKYSYLRLLSAAASKGRGSRHLRAFDLLASREGFDLEDAPSAMPLMDAFSRAMFRRAASGGDAENASEASSGGGQLPPLESASAFELEIPPMGASSGMWEGDSVLGSPGGSDASGLPSPGMSETPGSLRGGRKSLKKKRK